ncbi:putative enzyme related to lactoylglutathione lyase [Marmoricola sp. OAE513]|uniref:VOC family protein n=1 Tax=Marmoricola sp. OAE513 TaxID=2817894 RepID=UPI001AE3895F
MTFWQLTIDCRDAARLADFWAEALGWSRTPPTSPDTPWWRHYQGRADENGAFYDRLFDPEGFRPPLWFQEVPEAKVGKNRLHVDVYATGRDESLSLDERIAIVDAKVTALVSLGATVLHGERSDDPADPYCFVTLADPEGNEFCVG